MRIFPLILLLPLLAACSATPAVETLTPPGLPTATDSAPPAEPTATTESVPLALTVNGEGLPLDEFNAELERYRQAQTALASRLMIPMPAKLSSTIWSPKSCWPRPPVKAD
jgi:hypothetical protein